MPMLQNIKTDGACPVVNMNNDRGDDRQAALARIEKKRAANGMDLTYYQFTSSNPCVDLPLFIVVHGIGRRAIDQARLFAPFMEAIGGTLIAPVFESIRFSGYQRLRLSGKGCRPDLALQQLIKKVQGGMEKARQPVVMFGYSGGGQFVHRYAMAYPRQVKRMAVAAPGWFTFPDMRIKFPQGLLKSSALPDLNFDASRFLKIPSMVLVGENDVNRDKSVNQAQEIDHRQGRNRLERADRWIDAMKRSAKRYHYDTPYQFVVVKGCGHSFTSCMEVGQMGWQIIRFLFGEDPSRQFL